MTTDRMMDGPTRQGIEEAIRFIGPGGVYRCNVDDHEIMIVRLEVSVAGFVVACMTCKRLVKEIAGARQVYPAIFKHTGEPLPEAG